VTATTYDGKPVLYIKDVDGDGRFKAVDWNRGSFAGKRIYATVFSIEEKVKVEEVLARTENEHLTWQWRK